MNNKKLIFFLVASICSTLNASFRSPPDYEIDGTVSDRYFIRKINKEGIIEIRSAETLDLHWKKKIQDYDPIFSLVYISRNGQFLVHIKGNHIVRSLQDRALSIYSRDDREKHFPASEFIDSLIEYPKENWSSVSPEFLWFERVTMIDEIGIMLTMADQGQAGVFFKKMEVHRVPEQINHNQSE